MKKLSTVIADCDAGSLDQLRELCKSRTELHLVAECRNSEATRASILAHCPEVAFLAVELRPLNAYQLVREIPEYTIPLLVFTSAHERDAVRAFDLNAVDYVLRPIAQARFDAAMSRVMLRARAYESHPEHRLSVSDEGQSWRPDLRRVKAPRLIVEIGDQVHFIEIGDIESIVADRNYVWIHTCGDTHRVRATLNELERLLPDDQFIRVNRSTIINIRFISSIERSAHGEYGMHLCSGTTVKTGRRFRAQIPGAILRRHA